MELSAEERTAIVKLIALAWQTGNVTSPDDGAFLEGLRSRLINGADTSRPQGTEADAPE